MSSGTVTWRVYSIFPGVTYSFSSRAVTSFLRSRSLSWESLTYLQRTEVYVKTFPYTVIVRYWVAGKLHSLAGGELTERGTCSAARTWYATLRCSVVSRKRKSDPAKPRVWTTPGPLTARCFSRSVSFWASFSAVS